MIEDYLKTTFPVYDTVEKQNFRHSWCYDDVSTFALITSSLRLLPMQFKRSLDPTVFTDLTFTLWTYDDMTATDITTIIPSADFNISTIDGEDWLTYYGNIELLSELDCGVYYLEISDGTNTWYTEVFTVKQFETSTDIRKVRTISEGLPRKQRIIDTNKIRVIK